MTVTVDDKRCIGCGMCAAAVPEVFQVIGRVSTVLSQPAKERFFRVLDAANGCPVNAIRAERRLKNETAKKEKENKKNGLTIFCPSVIVIRAYLRQIWRRSSAG